MSIGQAKGYLKTHDKEFSDNDIKLLNELIRNDGRSGLIKEFDKLLAKRQSRQDEINRVKKLYDFQNTIAAKAGSIILGLDEVGRGPLAGPLTVGGVILKSNPLILGLNDSKKITENNRIKIADDIKQNALCWKTFSVPPKYIDNLGMTECLKRGFRNIVEQIENDGIKIDVVLLDGNPLYFDSREVNVVKGDAKCACISAASIIAKVERDSYMINISDKYPEYNFARNKGYGTAEHMQAIEKYGLSAIHRRSFCTNFLQMSLF